MAFALAGLDFHHLGLAVKDDGPALAFLSALGYQPLDRVFDPVQNVHVRLCVGEGRPTVELVQPGPSGVSPVDHVISRFNEMIYHTCYATSDAAATVAAWKAEGLKVQTLSPPRPAVLFAGRPVSFYRIPGVGIIELL